MNRRWLEARDRGELVRVDSLRRSQGGTDSDGRFVRLVREAAPGTFYLRVVATGEELLYAGCAELVPPPVQTFFACAKHDGSGLAPGGKCPLCIEEMN